MFSEDPTVFFSDFGENAIYANTNVNKQIQVIIDYDIGLMGFGGEMAEKRTVFTFVSDNDIKIGGTFTTQENKTFVIDAIVSGNDKIQSVSAVEQ